MAAVGITDGLQFVGYHHKCLFPDQFLDGLLDVDFVFRIECGGGFVKKYGRRDQTSIATGHLYQLS